MCTKFRPELNPASLVQLVHPDRERLKDGAFFTAVRDSGSVAVALDAAGKVFFWEKSGGSKLMPLTSFPHPNVSRTACNVLLLR